MIPIFRLNANRRPNDSARSRCGIAALIALICLSVATIVGSLLLQAAIGEQTYLKRLELKSQGEWLIEAGFSRARAQLAKSARYSGESWSMPGSSLDRPHDALVRIVVVRAPANENTRRLQVTATFQKSDEPTIEVSRDFQIR